MMVNMKHGATGVTRRMKLGFSWTTLFFGFFPALLRGDIKWAAIMFVLAIFTIGLAYLVFPFIYNRNYIREQIERGYIPADEPSRAALQAAGLYAQS